MAKVLLASNLAVAVLLAAPAEGGASPVVVREGNSSGTVLVWVACGLSQHSMPSTRCEVGEPIGAFIESQETIGYRVCVEFPGGREICAREQVARSATLYVNRITTSSPGRHRVRWFVGGETLEWIFQLVRAPEPDATRTCGTLPGDGAYRYIKVRGIACGPAMRVALRARRKFCSKHDRCMIEPPLPITKVFRGGVRYRGWSCTVKDGWELLAVRCRKRDMRLFLKSAA